MAREVYPRKAKLNSLNLPRNAAEMAFGGLMPLWELL
jgi:hypothetical protein